MISSLSISLASAQEKGGAVQSPVMRDKAGRPMYIDKDGDRVIILDFNTRKDLKSIAAFKDFDPTKAPMDPKSFYKETVSAKIIETPKIVYSKYTVEAGDTWESIAIKLYGASERATQLKLWNEDLLVNVQLPAGAQMRYVESKN